MSKQKYWMAASSGKSKANLSRWAKMDIENSCQPLVEWFKEQFIEENPNKRFNYPVDVYTRWRGNYLYFCEKFKPASQDHLSVKKAGGPETISRIGHEFEIKFVRLEYAGKDSFNFSYFRHTGQWFPVTIGITLNDCLEMMRDNPNFQPAH